MNDAGWPDYAPASVRSGDVVAREIRFAASKWSRLTAEDISGLGNADDLVAALVARYGLDVAQAHKIVEAAMRGVNR